MLLCLDNENYPLLDVEKAHKDLEGAHQPYMVHEVEKLDTIIFPFAKIRLYYFQH